MKIWMDGQLVDREQAAVSVFDHGVLYGDGVFEGIRIYNGRIFQCTAHMDRRGPRPGGGGNGGWAGERM